MRDYEAENKLRELVNGPIAPDTAMVAYSGTITVLARPMTRGEYNSYRGWQLPADEDPADHGYLTERTGVGVRPNMEGHAGYVSWSPADAFERDYRPVPGELTDGA